MTRTSRIGAPEWLILAGAVAFILVLWLSAYWEADIRWLHFFQAWMYLAATLLSLRGNRWGYFIGFSAAAFWDYSGLFVTNFVPSGFAHLAESVRTGHLTRPDQIVAVPAWLSNFAVVAGCLWAYARLKEKGIGDAARLILAFALTTGFFAADMALFQPRYLGLFPRLLHPHWP